MDARLAQEALLDGQARFEEWARKFMADWQLPVQRQNLKMIYSQLPGEAKEAVKQNNPEAYDEMNRFFAKNERRKR